MNEIVYVVLAGSAWDYDDATIAVYESKEQAELFAQQCNDYSKTKETGSFEGAERVAYFERLDTWYKNHPAGEEIGRSCDFYHVTEAPLIRSPK